MDQKKRKGKILFYSHTNKGIQVLLGCRTSKGETFWWLPGGGAEAGESFFEGAVREIGEELYATPEMLNALKEFEVKDPFYFEYVTGISENRIFFIEIHSSDPAIPGIKDEFDEIEWHPLNLFPENMSREYFLVKDAIGNYFKDLKK